MNFNDFLLLLPRINDAALPAESAHAKMSPPERTEIIATLDLDRIEARTAAVLLLCYPRNEKTHFVLILRNAYKGVHSSQVALPGGKKEPEDVTYQDTALRETCEEVGVARANIKMVRALSRIYIPPSNFIVYPYFGYCEQEPIFKPDPREVAGIIEVALDDLLDERTVVDMMRNVSYASEISVPGFQIGEHIVWGATAMILNEFKEVVNAIARA